MGRKIVLAVLGAVNWDTTLFESVFAEAGEEVPLCRVEEQPGGKGANVATAAARLLGRNRVAFVGALGEDDLEAPLRESLRSEGVNTDGLLRLKGESSGHAFVLVNKEGSKTIHTLFGANDALVPGHLKIPGVARALSWGSTVVIMDVPLSFALAAAKLGKNSGSAVVYSPGVRTMGDQSLLEEVLDLSDVLVLDRIELARVCPGKAPSHAARWLHSKHGRLTVIATLGESGCVVARRGSAKVVPAFHLRDLGLKAVNSTGSGDAFLAAYVCYSMSGLDPEQAATWGNLAGALKASKAETRGSPSLSELESSMKSLVRLKERPRGSPSSRASSRYRRRSLAGPP